MIYYAIQPPPSLAAYVRYFWVLECDVSKECPYVHRTMADGSAELVFHYKGVFDELFSSGEIKRSFTSGISGPAQKFYRYRVDTSFGIFGAYLYPFAIPRLLNIPATELSDQTPGLYEVLGQEGKDLEEKIMLAASNEERVQIIIAFLETKLSQSRIKDTSVFSSITHIIATKGTIPVEKLSGQYFLSTRQFERKFKEFAGFSPKLFSRITRFQSALREYGNKNKTLTQIAYDCGYYDQSHFIHDFKAFSGYHPRHYFSGNNEATSWKD